GRRGVGTDGRGCELGRGGASGMIGGRFDGGNKGAAWVFTRSGGDWNQQGGKLTGGGESGDGDFGLSVALAGDGAAALIGGPMDGWDEGGGGVVAGSGGAWSQQGRERTGG